jgi:hypothetical protein
MGSHRRFIFGLVATVALLVPAGAQAAFPGANGKIAFFHQSGTIDVVNPDGTGRATVYTPGDYGVPYNPTWLADGSTVTFALDNGPIGGVDETGSNFRIMAPIPANPYVADRHSWSPNDIKVAWDEDDYTTVGGDHLMIRVYPGGNVLADNAVSPSWSPDGKKIAFTTTPPPPNGAGGPNIISTMNADGTGQVPVPGSPDGHDPDWSPDGTRLVFGRGSSIGNMNIYVVNADGTGLTQLTSTGRDRDPTWSPDGTKIAFDSLRNGASHIFVMNADGTGQTDITPSDTVDNLSPYWQPIPKSYPRPRGATPTQIALVPAYAQCTSPNRTHGSPLSSGSCAPPTQTSSQLTTGTPDANGQHVNMYTQIKYVALPGDLGVTAIITDIRNKSDLSDYTGELSLAPGLRITDKNNTGATSGTVEDTTLPVTIPCTATTDTTVGSTCSLSTTVNSVYPGAVVAGKRAIWQLGPVKVYDGGSDGLASTTADNTLFLDQGVFVP